MSPLKAVSAYQSVLNNLRITPVYSKDGRIPDDLDMKFGELPEIEDRCAGTEIRYLLPGATPKTVIVEIFRCPIEEDYDDVRNEQQQQTAFCLKEIENSKTLILTLSARFPKSVLPTKSTKALGSSVNMILWLILGRR